jgi:hypothetical protein
MKYGALVSGNFFDVLGVKPYRGRTFIADGDKRLGGNPEVVLSYALWARRFGSDDKLIGQIITLNGTPYTVVGVTPQGFKGIVSLGRPDLFPEGFEFLLRFGSYGHSTPAPELILMQGESTVEVGQFHWNDISELYLSPNEAHLLVNLNAWPRFFLLRPLELMLMDSF